MTVRRCQQRQKQTLQWECEFPLVFGKHRVYNRGCRVNCSSRVVLRTFICKWQVDPYWGNVVLLLQNKHVAACCRSNTSFCCNRLLLGGTTYMVPVGIESTALCLEGRHAARYSMEAPILSLLQVRLELTTSASLCRSLSYRYHALLTASPEYVDRKTRNDVEATGSEIPVQRHKHSSPFGYFLIALETFPINLA